MRHKTNDSRLAQVAAAAILEALMGNRFSDKHEKVSDF